MLCFVSSGGLGAKNPVLGYPQKKYFLHSLINLAKIEEKPCLRSLKFKKVGKKNVIFIILLLLHLYFQIHHSVEWCHSVSTLSMLASNGVAS